MDYIAQVEKTLHDSIMGTPRIVLLVENEIVEREDYWERVYIVAWTRHDQSGTHRIHINSKGERACFIGHYDMTEEHAKHDALVRAHLASPKKG